MLPKVSQQDIGTRALDWGRLPKRFMNPGELDVLVALCRTVDRPSVIVEFGVNIGRTACALLETLGGIEHYVGIDVPPGYVTEKAVQRNEVPDAPGHMAAHFPAFQLLLRANGSHDLVEQDLPAFDIAFIDGDHSRRGVEQDTALAEARVRPGGLIIWHDYHDLGTVDVREVLNERRAAGRKVLHVQGTWIAFERF